MALHTVRRWLFAAAAVSAAGYLDGARVDSVEPRYIGIGGGAITIHGDGFSEDVFNFDNPEGGNKIWFANEFVSIPCQSPINWNFLLENPQDSSTKKITCDLPPRVGAKGSDWFNLILKVDGKEVRNNKNLNYRSSHTVYLRGIDKRYGKPGDLVTFNGRIFTKEYGNSNFGDEGSVNDRRENSITAVVVGTRECVPTDDLGNVYLIELDSPDSNEGKIACKPAGTFIGPMNATIMISGDRGKSLIHKDDNALSVNSKGDLFVYHTLPEVTEISPNTGGVIGGTHLKIKGNSFDAYPGKTQVKIGSTDCEIIDISSEELTCSTPKEEDIAGTNLGTRGLKYEIWTETVADVDTLDSTAADYQTTTLDGSRISGPLFNETNGFTAKLSGFFVAPYTGNMSFYLRSSDQSKLFISPDEDPANKVEIISHGDKNNRADPEWPHNREQVPMEEGKLYYIEAQHTQRSDKASENYLKISLWQHKTIYHHWQTKWARDEKWEYKMRYDRDIETQRITFENMPDDTQIRFTHFGKAAKMDAGVDGSSLGESIEGMLTYHCEYLQTRHFMKQDFEDPKYKLPGQGGTYREDVQAYCGKRALEGQYRVTASYWNRGRHIDGRKYPWFCWAALGKGYKGTVQYLIRWVDIHNRNRRDWIYIKMWEPSDDWSYQCMHFAEEASNPNKTWVGRDMKEGSPVMVEDVILQVADWGQKVFMDEVTISASMVEIERSVPGMANYDVLVDKVEVEEPEDMANTYDVKIHTWSCVGPDGDFNLLGVRDADIEELNFDGSGYADDFAMMAAKFEAQKEYLQTHENATFTSAAWNGGKVTISRKMRGSRKLEGSYSLTWNGKTVENVPFYLTPPKLASILEAEFGMVAVSTGYWDTRCWETSIKIEFTRSVHAGDIELMNLNDTNIIVDASDDKGGRFHIRQRHHGGMMIENPGADFFRLVASDPMVTVSVNDFMSSCVAADCTFTHQESDTPEASSLAAGQNSDGGVELTIVGTGFTDDLDDYVISLGDMQCAATAASASSVTCDLEPGPAGTYDLLMVVKSKGLVRQPTQLTHNVIVEIFSNTPDMGSLGGGTPITVIGTGFPADLSGWADGSVLIDGSMCKVTETTFNEFVCITDKSSISSRRRRSASQISITLNGESTTGGSFEYSASMTPTITSIYPTTSSPMGGDTLTITGTAFGMLWDKIWLGENECKIITWLETQIECVLPWNTHGDYDVKVTVRGNGYADSTGIPPVSYTFKITDMTPSTGSLMGGTQVKLTGAGFANCTNVEIDFGETMECTIEECTDEEVTCTTSRKPKIHQVTNGGKHPKYGPGYVWKPKEIEINPGDTVKWVWNLMTSSSKTGISVHRTASGLETEWDGKGFNSGEKSKNGKLYHTFNTPGLTYYSSQDVFGDSLFMTGTVKVVAPTEDETTKLSMRMSNIEAKHVPSGGASLDFSPCSLTESFDCVTPPDNTNDFSFLFSSCLTPSVSKIEIVTGASNISGHAMEGFDGSVLALSGDGFSTNLCQNQIKIGDEHECTVTAATSTDISCTVTGNGATALQSMKTHDLTVSVLNKGSSVLAVENADTATFNLVPRIISVTNDIGSWAGGSVMVFSGSGLVPFGGKDTVQIHIGEAPYHMGCRIIDLKFDYISCLVPDYTSKQNDMTEKEYPVFMYLGYDQLSPIVEAGNLTFTFTNDKTSTADSFSPTTISASAEVTIEGSNFGDDASKIHIFARNKNQPSVFSRRKRSLEDDTQEEEDLQEKLHPFWQAVAGGKPKWRTARSVDNLDGEFRHEDISDEFDLHERTKRNLADEIYESKDLESDDTDILDEICRMDVMKCMEMIDMMYQPEENHGRRKRAANEQELIEAAFNSEGSYELSVTSVSDTSIVVEVPTLPAGQYDIIIHAEGNGNAINKAGSLTSNMEITGVTPASGSINGGQTITIAGSGFSPSLEETSVNIGGKDCKVLSTSPSEVVCITSACSEGCGNLQVKTADANANSGDYQYLAASSPSIASITPSSASGAVDITITGANFGSSPTVTIGSSSCVVSAASDSEITCLSPELSGGDYPVVVYNSDLGLSNNDVLFSSILNIASISPSTGSFGGGMLLTVVGTGFSMDDVSVKICGSLCDIQSKTTTTVECLTPHNDSSDATLTCDIDVVQSSGTVSSAAAFTYDISLTPVVDSVSPLRGGTGGGTKIVISGSGFAATGNEVTLDGVICDITAESETEITCYTNHHLGSIKTPVVVDVPDQGYGTYSNVDDATFYYIDRWSSIWTWGGLGTPLEGEFIVITEGQTILLDTSTPKLKFLLIKGGTLMFDREQPELELQTEFILIVGGGSLQIGTEEEPYDALATITMHGHVRCTELPIFGCKVLGVRNGTLDFHGMYVPVTWTHLADTADAGATEIVLKQPVTWKAGDQIALATTSDRSSMKENEQHEIASISADGYTITLVNPLKYKHISFEQTFGDKVVETRGEVGLLTRNVKYRGHINEQFKEVLPACDQEFNSGGAFSDAMQTCFAGKFGEELGTDEMGAIIIISPKYKDQGLVQARIEYTEFNYVGQAFRVGRYPIHFHLPGNMNTSYVRGNAIHFSNNRACTLHDVANMVVERNVAYNIKGLSFFLEDGVELNNVLQYNLGIFTRMSNSLLNPDINPAVFWIVNPMNTYRHNACAGGTHFCYWLRSARIPDGPSYTRNYCPNKVPFAEFRNNTAHSMGWYGFWIFGRSNHAPYDPHTGDLAHGFCNGRRTQAQIGSFTTWNNKRGFEIVSGKNIRLENQTHMDHDFAAYEIFTSWGKLGEEGPGIYNSLIVGHSRVSDETKGPNACTPTGIALPESGYTLKDVAFHNFDRSGCIAMRQRMSEACVSPMPATVSGLTFENCPNKIGIANGEDAGAWYYDEDGSLTGTAGVQMMALSDTHPKDKCAEDTTGLTVGHPGMICDGDVHFHRFDMSGAAPSSLMFNSLTLKNDWGTSTRKFGWMMMGWSALVPQDTINWISVDTVEHITNISYNLQVTGFQEEGENFAMLGHQFYQEPDRISVLPGQGKVNTTASMTEFPTYETAYHGDWFYLNDSSSPFSQFVYILSNRKKGKGRKKKRDLEETDFLGFSDRASRKKRSPSTEIGSIPGSPSVSVEFRVYRCFYLNCIPPPPATLPPGRPADFLRWSDDSHWAGMGMTPPTQDSIVSIPAGIWMVMDIDPPPLKRIYVDGGLEIEDNADHKLECEILWVRAGKFEVGTPGKPFKHKFELVLVGDHFTEDMPMPDGPNVGAKALGVFGKLDMHGVDPGRTWSKLNADALAGSKQLTLKDSVSWKAGDEVVVSTTSHELLETERMKIASVSGKVITLTEPLKYNHIGSSHSLSDGSFSYDTKGEVGLLTRNVRIVGQEYKDLEEDMFGARVLIGKFTQEGTTYIGNGRFSNVEFFQAGQEGWSDNYDPRYSIAFLDIGTSENGGGKPAAKESWVKKCSFNWNYNSVVGLFGSNNIPVEDNVVYKFINDGIFDEGKGNKIERNLVTRGDNVARMKGIGSTFFYGCINTMRAEDTVMNGNVVAGCSQAGFRVLGVSCSQTYTWMDNEAHSSIHGIHLSNIGWLEQGCVNLKNFYSWKNYDYGIYSLQTDTVKIDNVVLVDNGVGFLSNTIGPSADSHKYKDKGVYFSNTKVIAASGSYSCDEDVTLDIWKAKMESGRRWKGRGRLESGKTMHHLGMAFPLFQSKPPKEKMAWHKPIEGAAGSNAALRGILDLDHVTFANFGETCPGKISKVFRTNLGQDDVNWPIRTSNITLVDVLPASKVHYDRPIKGKINPADCTDMDCDGMKKALIIDQDGSFLGSGSGTIITDNAFEWEGDPVRGYGYYRVPKPMFTTVDGDKIDVQTIMPNIGILRNDQCTYNPDWIAYECHGLNHRLMIIESLDRDSKIRRLSPVAVLANRGANGYIDLVNGLQDFSCCSGYTCAERLSTFWTMVATGNDYEIIFSSIPPQNFRFHILHNEALEGTRLKIWFPKQQRYDVYVKGNFIMPNNYDFSSEKYDLLEPDDSYIPGIAEPNGANFFDPRTGHLHLIVKGPDVVDIKTQPVVILKMGMAVDIENFFEENIVGNIAGLLGIDPSMIRVTNIVREGSVRRKKRSGAEEMELEFQIAPPPSDTVDENELLPPTEAPTAAPGATLNPTYTTAAPSATSAPNSTAMSFDELNLLQATIANNFQSGNISAALGVNVTGLSMEEPQPPPEAPPPPLSPEERQAIPEDGLTFAQQAAQADAEMLEMLLAENDYDIPENLVLDREPANVKEIQPMKTFPRLYTTNADGDFMTAVGDESDPWIVTAYIKQGPGGSLVGNVTAPIIDGYAEFDNLAIDQMGSGYQLSFNVTYPAVSLSSAETSLFNVASRPLSIRFVESPSMAATAENFTIELVVWDAGMDQEVDPAIVAGIGWDCNLQPLPFSTNLTGETEGKIKNGKTTIKFTQLSVSEMRPNQMLRVTCQSKDGTMKVITATSDPFPVYPFPETGLLRKTTTAFGYRGLYSNVQDIVGAFDPSMGTCTLNDDSCNVNMAGKKKRSVSEMEREKRDTVDHEHICNWPICLDQRCNCHLGAVHGTLH